MKNIKSNTERKWSVTRDDFQKQTNWYTLDQYGSTLQRIKIPMTRMGWYEEATNRGLFRDIDDANNYRNDICDMLGDYGKHLENTDNIGTTEKNVTSSVYNALGMAKKWAGYDDFDIQRIKGIMMEELSATFKNVRNAQDTNISEEIQEVKEDVRERGLKAITDTVKRANRRDHKIVKDNADSYGVAHEKRKNANSQINNALNRSADLMQSMGLLDIKITAQNVIAKEVGYYFQDLFHKLADRGIGIFSSVFFFR